MTISADDLNYCRELAQREQYPFYLISLFTPEATRQAWWALLTLQAELAKIRSTVTNPLAGQIRLQWWRDTLVQCAGNNPPAHPVARALNAVIQQFKLPLAPFEILVEAREDDFGAAPADAHCFANYGRATTVPLLQLLLACEGWDAPTQGKWFPWLDAIGTEWGQLQALKIWPQLASNVGISTPTMPVLNKKPYLTLLNILLKAQPQNYGIGTLIKLWWQARRCAAPII